MIFEIEAIADLGTSATCPTEESVIGMPRQVPFVGHAVEEFEQFVDGSSDFYGVSQNHGVAAGMVLPPD